MEKESFENEQVAELLNSYYVSIKVDREERPDVDTVYMAACQALYGQGGWPLTIIMTPEQIPFFAATYIPLNRRYGSMGMLELLPLVHKRWSENPHAFVEAGTDVTIYLRQQMDKEEKGCAPDREYLKNAFTYFRKAYDKENGGFGPAPKFPTPHNLLFLLKYAYAEENKEAFNMVEKTLIQMFRGGIFDHIGGGFSRYSTDEKWLVPHFEKMLYDNALLCIAYMDTAQIANSSFYRKIGDRVLEYVLNELRSPEGGFYCGQDADSEGIEGKYYVFTEEEINNLLETAEGQKFNQWFGITEKGNFEGKSIPNLLLNQRYSEDAPISHETLQKLIQYRKERTFLHKDDKILTSWNGLMIAALAKAYKVTGNEDYAQAADLACQFIEKNLKTDSGRLRVSFRKGTVNGEGKLDDYVFYSYGLLELFHATLKPEYLLLAKDLTETVLTYFQDENKGGFFLYASDGEQLIVRPKETHDGAIPSGNSVALYVLQQLAGLTGEERLRDATGRQLHYLAGVIKEYPAGHTFALAAMMQYLYPSADLVCVTDNEDRILTKIADLQKKAQYLNLRIILKSLENKDRVEEAAPYLANYPIKEGMDVFYLCKN